MSYHFVKSLLYTVCLKDRLLWQLSWGCLIGFWIGFIPENILFDSIVFLILLSFRFNLFMAFLGWILGIFLQWLLFPVMQWIGLFLLTKWSTSILILKCFYMIPFFAYLNFNYTAVCGAYVLSLFLSVCFYFFIKFIYNYLFNSYSVLSQFMSKLAQ